MSTERDEHMSVEGEQDQARQPATATYGTTMYGAASFRADVAAADAPQADDASTDGESVQRGFGE